MSEHPDNTDSSTDGRTGSGGYRYATVVRTVEDDPRNDIPAGQVRLIAGRHEDGWSYTILDEEREGFREVQCETLGVVCPCPIPKGKQGIVAWAAETDAATGIAEGAA